MTEGAARHALIIEDELAIGIGMQLLLSDLGFGSFAFAGTQAQALEQARLRRPDLVTVDVGLLDGDGLAAAQALKDEFGALPLIFVTGDRQAAEGFGAIVVEKPFGASELSRAVEAAGAAA